jgi:dihydroorotate dehydrogenase electron transfer subunit
MTAGMIETIAHVVDNRELAPGYRLLTVDFGEALDVLPGQFAMLRAHDFAEPLLRRALAIYDAPEPGRLCFLYQVLGRGTQALAQLGSGERAAVLLPLGNHWALPASSSKEGVISRTPAARDSRQIAAVVAGGIGSASLLMLAKQLRRTEIEAHIFFGAASGRAAVGCGLEDFRALGLPLTVSTDDGSVGEAGFVTAPLERFLERQTDSDVTVYSCGPWPMMARTAQLSAAAGVQCLVSLEAPMACGFGVCVGCVFAVKTSEPRGYGSYKRVCTDGTIFPAEEVDWEISAMSH